ncbi:hypothetical protein DNH61_09785 [Paenibacillus sambharensis]|uniref:Uncharacterized protein n=1 Tax=Paenibacillus sambharensis TaxID=1803190 RepID=A0A2W1LMH7_9BACL|nr:hypothetical protein [Paenibacillus sambharensis]PZD96182.1 hypothetical protein DNH61_09785 [Paenibacillus sambharensis]
MQSIELRPDMKTSGGEMSDIMIGGRYAGSLTLLYREGDRVAGSIQLEQESLKKSDKDSLMDYLQQYIQSFIHAIGARECDVIVTYSSYDKVVTTAPETDFAFDAEEQEEQIQVIDVVDDEAGDELWTEAEAEYDLVVVRENNHEVEYHVYDTDGNWAAEAFIRPGLDVSGRIRWVYQPDDEEIELITELLISDFDDNAVDSFSFEHYFEDQLIDIFELTHEELLETPVEMIGDDAEEDYSVILARDDGDILTYEIYRQSAGGLPIGTATVDIERRMLTGYIDFQDSRTIEDAELIASLLMRELDKEKDYDGLNLSLMYRNERVDEIIFENETVH